MQSSVEIVITKFMPGMPVIGLLFTSRRSRCKLFVCHRHRTDNRVRADHGAEGALDAVFRNPLRNIDCNAALLISGGALREVPSAYFSKVETGRSLPWKVLTGITRC